MRILIVDDEPIARQVLRELLEDIPGVTLAGEAASGPEAVDLVFRLRPDLLLLDLQMPGLDGIGVARALSAQDASRLPLIVYVTAYEQHALQAFDLGAVDYLLKPVRRERLRAALEKARTQLAGLQPAAPPSPIRKIAGRSGASLHLFDPADVIAFQAEGDVVYLFTAAARYYSDLSLKALEQRLPRHLFRRIHRSTIVNTAHIRQISPLKSKRWQVVLSGGMKAVVSKRMAGVIRAAIHF